MRWCTVTVTDPDGRRHSVDVQATSTFDAAHLFVVEAKKERAVGLPKPTLATIFEVVAAGKIYHVTGRLAAMDCGKARFVERTKGIPVLPTARLGIMESRRTRLSTPVIRIGPAGWKYKDWEGVVYPQPAPRGFDPLAYIAEYFTTVEINSSYYGPPQPATARKWVNSVGLNRDFRFTAKLYHSFTHERSRRRRMSETTKRDLRRSPKQTGSAPSSYSSPGHSRMNWKAGNTFGDSRSASKNTRWLLKSVTLAG